MSGRRCATWIGIALVAPLVAASPALAAGSRRVDPETGAFVRSTGPGVCKVRTADVGGQTLVVGPDGTAETLSDNPLASSGNCLLFDGTPDPDGVQRIRDAAAIALDHPVDLALFQTLCAAKPDAEAGVCPFSRFFLDDLFAPIGGLTAILGLRTTEWRQARVPTGSGDPLELARWRPVGPAVLSAISAFLPSTGASPAFGLYLSPQSAALLGCGLEVGVGCDPDHGRALAGDPATADVLRLPLVRPLTGVDPSLADASALLQEFGALKALRPGEPVGARSDPARVEAGVSALDARIEPHRWLVDPRWLAAGRVVFLDSRGPDRAIGTADDAAYEIERGEECTPLGIPAGDARCSDLEVFSSNLERVLIAWDTIGPDRRFDPPESVAEILAATDADPSNDATGDPRAGPDGIRFNDFDANGDGAIRDGIDEAGDQKAGVAQPSVAVADSFLDCLRGTGAGPLLTVPFCFLNLGRESIASDPGYQNGPDGPRVALTLEPALVAVFPVGFRVEWVNEQGSYVGRAMFPLQRLTPAELGEFFAANEVRVPLARLTDEERAALEPQLFGGLPAALATIKVVNRLRASNGTLVLLGPVRSAVETFFSPGVGIDPDQTRTPDLDLDRDAVFDAFDDGTPGPVTDDAFECGSGIPGDPLQDVAMHDLDAQDRLALAAAFPGGYPPRSSLRCPSVLAYLDATGSSPPGRRDFVWHGGTPGESFAAHAREAAIAYDLEEMTASIGRLRASAKCGRGRNLPCARFDLDGVGAAITTSDFQLARRAREATLR
jgi:hypothetical protein